MVRKWFNRVIDELCGAGYIKKTDVKINGKGPARRCLHLLKTPTPNERAEDLPLGPLDFPIRIKTMKEDIPILHVLIDSSLESQILQVLQASGENGATQRVSSIDHEIAISDLTLLLIGNWFCIKFR